MSAKKPQMPEMYELWAMLEQMGSANNARYVMIIGIVALFLVISVFANFVLFQQWDAARADRIMYAAPMGDGSWISSRTRPPEMVQAFGDRFIAHFYNYDPESAGPNFAQALKMMDSVVRQNKEDDLENLLGIVQRDALTQDFTIMQRSAIEETNEAYLYKIRGRAKVWVGVSFYETHFFEVTLVLRKVMATNKRFEGLAVSDIQEKELSRL